MSDYIDRQAAIEVCDWYEHEFPECEYAIRLVSDDMKKLPSADVEPVRRGRWEFIGGRSWSCVECGWIYAPNKPKYNYCPNCGARMDGEQG